MTIIARRILPVFLAAGLLAGCATNQYGEKQTVGTVLGGVAGGLAGAQMGKGKGQLAATAAGALLGAFMGSEVGKSLDRADRAYLQQANQSALETAPTGQAIAWSNPDSGNSGSITPVRTYEPVPGQHCREFQQTITVGGQSEQAYGTACRQPDGNWKITN